MSDSQNTKKRKRADGASTRERPNPKSQKQDAGQPDAADLLLLEEKILGSSKHRAKHITTLIGICDDEQADGSTMAAVSLCRVFCRLLVGRHMVKTSTSTPDEIHAIQRLKALYMAYADSLSSWLASPDSARQCTALTLLMRLVKHETSQQGRRGEQAWTAAVFSRTITALISDSVSDAIRGEYAEKYMDEYDDVRFYTFQAVSRLLESTTSRETVLDGCISILTSIENIPSSADQFDDWYGQAPQTPKHPLLSLSAHQKQAEEAWLAVFGSHHSRATRKRMLASLTATIVPWFTRPERLMDFLTDCYNEGGATSLLALSGLFQLMQQRNLDYPQFFSKLYSLLDQDILHSKHRSRFFRLLDQFMASTHLPAALVASFVKRLSRLALSAPPGGIVVVLPWVYNMLKRHPTCTFMIHREIRDPKTKKHIEGNGLDDCFDMQEPDPIKTRAIDSCLWELETLQSHYHPNVATLAKIISDQFTKRSYNLEDFLDHTYQGMIDAELAKDLRKAPVSEFEIPKRIFTAEEGGLNRLGTLLETAICAELVAA